MTKIFHSTPEERADWLLKHRYLWINLTNQELRGNQPSKARLFKAMVAAGLFSKTTSVGDVNLRATAQLARLRMIGATSVLTK